MLILITQRTIDNWRHFFNFCQIFNVFSKRSAMKELIYFFKNLKKNCVHFAIFVIPMSGTRSATSKYYFRALLSKFLSFLKKKTKNPIVASWLLIIVNACHKKKQWTDLICKNKLLLFFGSKIFNFYPNPPLWHIFF